MKTIMTSVWAAVLFVIGVSFVCYQAAGAIGADYTYRTGAAELPLISKAFYSGSIYAYLYPLPLVIWAAFWTSKNRNAEQALTLITCSLGASILFLAVFVYAMVLPYTFILVRPISD